MTNNQNKNPGNFAQDKDRAREAGKKGGQMSHNGRQDQSNRTKDQNSDVNRY